MSANVRQLSGSHCLWVSRMGTSAFFLDKYSHKDGADATFPTKLSQGNYQQIEFLEDVGGLMVIKGWDGSGMLGVLL